MARIAVVDDDLNFQELMQDILHELGWMSMACTTTLDAYTALRTAPPDVVLLDIRMETTHAGWDVLSYMQLHPVLCQVPVIVCSAMADELAAKRGWLAEHDICVLPKPFDLDHLQEMIEECLLARQSALVCAV